MESNPYGQPLRTINTWGELPNMFKYYSDCNILSSGVSQLECLLDTSADKLLEAQLKAQISVAVELKWFTYVFMPWTPTMFVFISHFFFFHFTLNFIFHSIKKLRMK